MARKLAALATCSICLAAAAPAGAVTLNPGDILIADTDAFTGSKGGVIHVDPATGKQTVLSSNDQAVNAGSSEFFADPFAVTVAPNGQVLVADSQAFDFGGGVISVDPATGKQTKLSANDMPINDGASEHFADPSDLTVDESGQILVVDQSAFSGGGVIGVDPANGKETVVSHNDLAVNIGSSEFFASPTGLDIGPGGEILVTDQSAFSDMVTADGGVISVNPANGKETKVSANDLPINDGVSEFFRDPYGIGVTSTGEILVADQSAFTNLEGGVIDVNPANGQEGIVSNNDLPANDGISDYFVNPSHMAIGLDDEILVVDEGAFTASKGGVIEVDPTDGKETIVSNNEQPANVGTSEFFLNPSGIAVVPEPPEIPVTPLAPLVELPTCLGRPATIVGTSGDDALQGTSGADVIAALGGGDEVIGRGGKDRICGGDGNDLLKGGAGRDRIAGEAGHDLLLGGKRDDRCLGGPGTNSLRSC